MSEPIIDTGRYSRQVLCEHIGEAGQARLRTASLTLVGCGALGSVLGNTLVRAGIGFLRIIDRDFIEVSNLQRQTLFDEHDIRDNLPKAEAAARKLRRINSAVEIDAVVDHVDPRNVEAHCGEADLILDGTDNLETRYLLNDVAVKHRIPWVYGACVASEGVVMAVVPGETPCLRCVWDTPPPPGATPTCDTIGVLAAAVQVVASLQATEVMKILMGKTDQLIGLVAVDAWTGSVRCLRAAGSRRAGDCPCCGAGHYEFLEGGQVSTASVLCGRNAVQVLPAEQAVIDLKRVAGRLRNAARVRCSGLMLRFNVEAFTVTLFPDGRAIVEGTSDAATAKRVVAKYVGI